MDACEIEAEMYLYFHMYFFSGKGYDYVNMWIRIKISIKILLFFPLVLIKKSLLSAYTTWFIGIEKVYSIRTNRKKQLSCL